MKRPPHGPGRRPDVARLAHHGRAANSSARFDDYVAAGHHAAAAFLTLRPHAVQRLLIGRDPPAEIVDLARKHGISLEPASPPELDRWAGGVPHQGVVALGAWPPGAGLKEIIAQAPRVLLALDGVTDPRNAGAILRSAEGLGAGGVILQRDRVVGGSAALVKAAAGAIEWMPLVRVPNLVRGLEDLREAGFWIIGLSGAATVDLDAPGALPGYPLVLVVGAEDHGLRRLVAATCHRLVRIPMRGHTPSLNVSVAAAIALHHALVRVPPQPPGRS